MNILPDLSELRLVLDEIEEKASVSQGCGDAPGRTWLLWGSPLNSGTHSFLGGRCTDFRGAERRIDPIAGRLAQASGVQNGGIGAA